jgi:hypothetical protein
MTSLSASVIGGISTNQMCQTISAVLDLMVVNSALHQKWADIESISNEQM